MKFSNAYAGHATCAPSRATLLTGRHASKFGYEYLPLTTTFATLVSWPQKQNLYKDVVPNVTATNSPNPADLNLPLSETLISEVTIRMYMASVCYIHCIYCIYCVYA